MKICIVLPGIYKSPVGGYKVVYEYANRLSREGYSVVILFLNDSKFKDFHFPEIIRKMLANAYTVIMPRWFRLDQKIRKVSNQKKGFEQMVSDADIAIATSPGTVHTVQSCFSKSSKWYFIQGYEIWGDTTKRDVEKTYSLGMTNIVISNWLKKIVDKHSKEAAVLISNPVDTNVYKVYNCIENRNKYRIGLLYHEALHKGFQYAYEALMILKKWYPQLEVFMFGVPPKPSYMPEWVKYYQNASEQQTVKIYNNVAVFICASIAEGYGLTGAESMACGAALASTDYEGVREYAENGKNALLSPVRDAEALAENAARLIENDSLRISLAYSGVKTMQNHSWDNAMKLMNELIKKCSV